MSKTILAITALLAASSMFAACHNETYKIKGSGNMLKDGDTLFITNDFTTGTPIDTAIVRDGKFILEGKADSTFLCMIYSKNHQGTAMPFFIEPGEISLTLSDNPTERKVSGSTINDKWQEMNDSVLYIGQQIGMIATRINSAELTAEENEEQIKKYEQLMERFRNLILDRAEKNTDNEFGYFLLTYYDDMMGINETNSNEVETKLKLINRLPKKMRQRQAIKAVIERLNKQKSTAEGCKISDFQMNNIDDKPISILAEIKKNKITVIDFWASWCGPCLHEMPSMLDMYNRLKDKGLGIVGISLDSRKEDWEKATKRIGIEWTQMSDLRGWNNAAAQTFNVQSIPYTIVVDADGVILKKGLRGTELEKFVSERLK